MILKSYIVEKDHKILSKFKSVLMYGENQGVKEDIKEKILKDSIGSEVINLFHEEIYGNKEILNNFISNSSLFSEKKIIFIHEVSDKIFDEVFEALNNLTEDVKIFIFSKSPFIFVSYQRSRIKIFKFPSPIKSHKTSLKATLEKL